MANDGGVRNYLNTLIFCIVAKGITVLLLIALFFEPVQLFAYFVITIEVFLIVIVILSLISISKYEKQKRKAMENAQKDKANIQSCPDYYVRGIDEEHRLVCKNIYNTPDGRYTYEIGHNNDPQTKTMVIDNELMRKKNVTYEEVCNMYNTDRTVPWTDLRAKCNFGI